MGGPETPTFVAIPTQALPKDIDCDLFISRPNLEKTIFEGIILSNVLKINFN